MVHAVPGNMTASDTDTPPPAGGPVRRRVGRPPQIDRQAIADAARAVGLTNLTLKAVADHLGVSVAGLYHHIRGKDDLLRLAAERTAADSEVPLDHGQHWAEWLAEWAVYNYDAFVTEPLLVDQFLAGAINTESIAGTTDAILGTLVRQGFTIAEANAAYQLTSSCALGSALKAIRHARSRAAGRSEIAELYQVLDEHEPGDLPYLRQYLVLMLTDKPHGFAAALGTALSGIAVTRGESPDDVGPLVARALDSGRAL